LYRVKDMLRKWVSFRQGNILDSISLAGLGSFDYIFCRNVLIYFDEESRMRAISNLVDVLRPGGYLFLGHSESLIGLQTDLEVLDLNHQIFYRKKADAGQTN